MQIIVILEVQFYLQFVDNGLLSYDIPPSMDPMYNFFNELSLSGNTLKIKGTSHNAFVSYSKNDTVKENLFLKIPKL